MIRKVNPDAYQSGGCCGQIRPDSPTGLRVKAMLAELHAIHFPTSPCGPVRTDQYGYPVYRGRDGKDVYVR